MATNVHAYFLHNWVSESRLVTRWLTDVTQSSAALAEERTSLCERPYRTLTLRWTGINRDEAQRILMHLTRAAYQRIYIPLYMDQSIVTATSSGTTINCDTTNRRFYVGYKVLIHALGTDGRLAHGNAQLRTITAVSSTTITVDSALTGSFAVGAVVYPATLWEIRLETVVPFITEEHCSVEASFDEIPGLPPAAAATSECIDPSVEQGTSSHTGFGFVHIFGANTTADHRHNWTENLETTVVREGHKQPRGRGESIFVRGARPKFKYKLKLTCLNRSDAFYYIRYFDSKKGRQLPFFLGAPHKAWEISSISFTYLDILPCGNIDDIRDFVEYVMFNVQGNVHPFRTLPLFVNKISSVDDNGATWRINFSDFCVAALVSSLVRSVSIASFVRFAEDAMEEVWTNDGVCEILYPPMIEILAEAHSSSIAVP